MKKNNIVFILESPRGFNITSTYKYFVQGINFPNYKQDGILNV